jgi:hypothetical protein
MRLNTTAPALLRVRLARGQALQPSWQSPHRSLHDQPLADEKDVKPSIGQTDGIAATRSLALTSRWALSATVGAGSAPCRHRGSVGSVLQAAATCPRTAGAEPLITLLNFLFTLRSGTTRARQRIVAKSFLARSGIDDSRLA